MFLGTEHPRRSRRVVTGWRCGPARVRRPELGLVSRGLQPLFQVLGALFGMLRAGWRGELPLWLAVPTFMGACWAIDPLFNAIYRFSPPSRVAELLLLTAWAASLWLVLLWSGVGVWRCVRTSSDGGGSMVLAVGALALVLLVGAQALPAAQEAGCVAASVWRQIPPLQPGSGSGDADAFWFRAAMRYDASSRTLWVTGAIERGTSQDFITALEQHPQTQTIGLVSPGGYVDEMRAMSERIRDRQLDTFAPARCASACVSLFAAGAKRWVSTQSRFGLHRSGHECFKDTGLSADDLLEAATLRAAGVTEEFIQNMLSTPYHSIWQPELKELLTSGLAGGVREIP